MKRTTRIALATLAVLALLGLLGLGLWEGRSTPSPDHPLEEPVPRFESFSFEEYRTQAESASISSKTLPPQPKPTTRQKEPEARPPTPPLQPPHPAAATPPPPSLDPDTPHGLGPARWIAPAGALEAQVDRQLDELLPPRQAARDQELALVRAHLKLREDVAGRINECVATWGPLAEEDGAPVGEGRPLGVVSVWLEDGALGAPELTLVSQATDALKACLSTSLQGMQAGQALEGERRRLEFGVASR